MHRVLQWPTIAPGAFDLFLFHSCQQRGIFPESSVRHNHLIWKLIPTALSNSHSTAVVKAHGSIPLDFECSPQYSTGFTGAERRDVKGARIMCSITGVGTEFQCTYSKIYGNNRRLTSIPMMLSQPQTPSIRLLIRELTAFNSFTSQSNRVIVSFHLPNLKHWQSCTFFLATFVVSELLVPFRKKAIVLTFHYRTIQTIGWPFT